MQEETFNYIDYSNLIGLIYDAAHKPTLWPELLEEMGEHFTSNPSYASMHSIEEALIPHFSRAIAINQKILKLETKNNTSNQILNRLPIGVIVTNNDAKIIAMNERAMMVLNDGSTLSDQQGHIQSNNREQSNELQQLIQSYAADSPPDKGASLLIKGHETYFDTSVWITASDAHAKEIFDDANVAIIYIASSLIQPEFDVETIQSNFGLSVAEAKLVKALVNGCHNLNDVAEKLNLSIHTVRTQIKHVFEKTDTNNQMELVKKVLTSPSAIFGKSQTPHKISLRTISKHDSSFEACLSITLHDGRRLAYAEYGDPEGAPVFVFHAVFGSRLQYPAHETTAASLGLRMIVVDRPGHGYSDQKTGRSLLDWADDIGQLADQLEIEKFSVLSVSGGCSYALACAYKIPQRIKQTVIVSGRGPIDSLDETLSIDRLVLGLARHAPAIFARFAKVLTADLVKGPTKSLQRRNKNMSDADKAYIAADEANRAMYAASLIESVRQGSEGITQDIITNMNPWGFSPADITANIRLWHGLEDRAFPPHTAQQLVDELTTCESTFVADIGSLLILAHWDEILADLVKKA